MDVYKVDDIFKNHPYLRGLSYEERLQVYNNAYLAIDELRRRSRYFTSLKEVADPALGGYKIIPSIPGVDDDDIRDLRNRTYNLTYVRNLISKLPNCEGMNDDQLDFVTELAQNRICKIHNISGLETYRYFSHTKAFILLRSSSFLAKLTHAWQVMSIYTQTAYKTLKIGFVATVKGIYTSTANFVLSSSFTTTVKSLYTETVNYLCKIAFAYNIKALYTESMTYDLALSFAHEVKVREEQTATYTLKIGFSYQVK
jgi:hypothetical protein